MVETKKSFCRMCHAFCGVEVDIEDNRVLAVRGDTDNALSQGYTCIKGRNMAVQHHHPDRIRSALKRTPDGNFEPIPSEQAMDEVAARLREIIDRDGRRAVATYNGTYAFLYGGLLQIANAWHKGLGSPSMYTSASIDQPGKAIAAMRHGTWGGGNVQVEQADVLMMVGTNPIASMFGGPRFAPTNPAKRLRDEQQRGMKLVVIDPRKSDVAKRADIHLQVKPGEDPTLLAGIIRVIIEEGIYDGDFCAAHVEGFEELSDAVRKFTPEYVEQRTGVPAQHMIEAARLFAGAALSGATSGTGTSMAPRSNLTEQLVLTLNSVCGGYLREGDTLPNPGTLTPPRPFRAQAMGGGNVPQAGERSRVKGIGAYMPGGDMPTAILADEILTPGEGQVRALITFGGNPVVAWPDQLKAIDALNSLDLNVAVDIKMSASTKLCDYVFGAKLGLERVDVGLLGDGWHPRPFQQYAPAIIEAEGDVITEWELFWGLAKRLGFDIVLPGGPMPMDQKPTGDEFFDLLCAGSRVPLDEVRKHPSGAIFPADVKIESREPGHDVRLKVGHPELLAELRDVRSEPVSEGGGYAPDEQFTHRLISRRTLEVYSSSARDLPAVKEAGVTTNFAWMNAIDLAELGVSSGDVVEITSDRASILGV
ncbi:MAG TPA: molybdopterin-dependent oxidoreductase, partial [Dehalococcoidia bacterium]|nr:molybdopterin-dependent oxidoreductase [Dehalococcoidia bacterium]